MTDRPTHSPFWRACAIAAAIATPAIWGPTLHAQQSPDPAKAFQDSVVARQNGEGTCFGCHGPNLEGTAIAPTSEPINDATATVASK